MRRLHDAAVDAVLALAAADGAAMQVKHGGPGPHSTGTPQAVHGGGTAGVSGAVSDLHREVSQFMARADVRDAFVTARTSPSQMTDEQVARKDEFGRLWVDGKQKMADLFEAEWLDKRVAVEEDFSEEVDSYGYTRTRDDILVRLDPDGSDLAPNRLFGPVTGGFGYPEFDEDGNISAFRSTRFSWQSAPRNVERLIAIRENDPVMSEQTGYLAHLRPVLPEGVTVSLDMEPVLGHVRDTDSPLHQMAFEVLLGVRALEEDNLLSRSRVKDYEGRAEDAINAIERYDDLHGLTDEDDLIETRRVVDEFVWSLPESQTIRRSARPESVVSPGAVLRIWTDDHPDNMASISSADALLDSGLDFTRSEEVAKHLKNTVATDLAEAITDMEAMTLLAAYSPGDTAVNATSRYRAASDMVQAWAQSSNDQHAPSLWAQEAAAEEFVVAAAGWHKDPTDLKPGMDPRPLKNAQRKVLRRMYEKTQARFAEQGVTHVKVYRGQNLWSGKDRPMASWTTNIREAQSFSGKGAGAVRVDHTAGDTPPPASGMVRYDLVPVERVLCTPGFGFGCLNEHEVVLLADVPREMKHGGPGLHSTGTPQEVHGGGGVPGEVWDIPWERLATVQRVISRAAVNFRPFPGASQDAFDAVYPPPADRWGSKPAPGDAFQSWAQAGWRGDPRNAFRGIFDADRDDVREMLDEAERLDAVFEDAMERYGFRDGHSSYHSDMREAFESGAIDPDEYAAVHQEALNFYALLHKVSGIDTDATGYSTLPNGEPWSWKMPDTARWDDLQAAHPNAPFSTERASLVDYYEEHYWETPGAVGGGGAFVYYASEAEEAAGDIPSRRVMLHRREREFAGTPSLEDATARQAAAAAAIGDPERSRISTWVPSDVLGLILADGRMKNQYEAKTSGGMYSPAKRKKYETLLFGLPPKGVKSKDRPIYGFVTDRDRPMGIKGGSHYGDVTLVLKDSVRARTTVTQGDSLDETGVSRHPDSEPPKVREEMLSGGPHAYGPMPGIDDEKFVRWAQRYGAVPLPVDAMKDPTLARYIASPTKVRGWPDERWNEDTPITSFWGYHEAQIHGGVKVTDIEKVAVPEGYHLSEGNLAALAEAGIPVEYIKTEEKP